MSNSREWQRRYNQRYPFRNRWLIVKLRARTWTFHSVTWQQVWDDLVYLVRG